MIRELDVVALTEDFPDYGLKAGDIGAVVLDHEGRGYEVEFLTVAGETVAVISVYPHQIRGITPEDIPSARRYDSEPWPARR